MFEDTVLLDYKKVQDIKHGVTKTEEDYKKLVRNRKLAVCFIRRSNLRLYGPNLDHLRDKFLAGRDEYPRTLKDAYALL